jgi:hypothetical protein
VQQRKEYLSRGLKLLSELKQAGRLHANQDWSDWFDNALFTKLKDDELAVTTEALRRSPSNG